MIGLRRMQIFEYFSHLWAPSLKPGKEPVGDTYSESEKAYIIGNRLPASLSEYWDVIERTMKVKALHSKVLSHKMHDIGNDLSFLREIRLFNGRTLSD